MVSNLLQSPHDGVAYLEPQAGEPLDDWRYDTGRRRWVKRNSQDDIVDEVVPYWSTVVDLRAVNTARVVEELSIGDDD